MLSWAPPTGGSVLLAGLAALQPAGATKRRAASDAEFAAETLGSRGGKPCGPGFSTGVLISPRTVLTAGHCSGGKFEVFLQPVPGAARRVGVREAIIHPKFRRGLSSTTSTAQLVRPVRVTLVPIASRVESWDLIRRTVSG